MDTTFSSYNFQQDNICDFSTEADARSFLIKRIERSGFPYREEYTLKPSRLRLDLVVKVEDEYLPVEIKKSLVTASLFSQAVAQAHSYANEIKRPVFIGPLLARSHQQVNNLKFANVLAGRLNVGIIWCGSYNLDFYLGEKPILKFNERFKRTEISLQHFLYREARGSKRKVTGV